MLHHLLRVHRPTPSRKHTLAGLWRGRDLDDASDSSVIIRVEYSFAGHAAQIVATQVRRASRLLQCPYTMRTYPRASPALSPAGVPVASTVANGLL